MSEADNPFTGSLPVILASDLAMCKGPTSKVFSLKIWVEELNQRVRVAGSMKSRASGLFAPNERAVLTILGSRLALRQEGRTGTWDYRGQTVARINCSKRLYFLNYGPLLFESAADDLSAELRVPLVGPRLHQSKPCLLTGTWRDGATFTIPLKSASQEYPSSAGTVHVEAVPLISPSLWKAFSPLSSPTRLAFLGTALWLRGYTVI